MSEHEAEIVDEKRDESTTDDPQASVSPATPVPASSRSLDAYNDDDGGYVVNSTKKTKTRQGRHGARNQHRHKHFAKWLLQTFPQLQSFSSGEYVLDVAGGKGELAARLCFCHRCKVVMVDPRKANVASCFQAQVLPKLPNKWQQRLYSQLEENPQFLHDIVDERFRQLVMTFDEHTVQSSKELQDAVLNASLIIGMHADGATEAIVEAAIRYKKPFVVVPCCVFPRLFSQRTIQENGRTVQVRSHEQFCRYLLEKDPRFIREVLPFEGRNVAIWWGGESGSSGGDDSPC